MTNSSKRAMRLRLWVIYSLRLLSVSPRRVLEQALAVLSRLVLELPPGATSPLMLVPLEQQLVLPTSVLAVSNTLPSFQYKC